MPSHGTWGCAETVLITADRNSDEERMEEAFDKAYADALAVDAPSPITGKVRKEETGLFAACNEVIATSSKLVERFNALEAELKTHFWEHPAEKWQKDKDDLVEIMALGRKHGEKLVNNVLAPTKSPAKLVNAKATAHEKTASVIFQESHKASQGDLWGTVACAVAAHGTQLDELVRGGSPSSSPRRKQHRKKARNSTVPCTRSTVQHEEPSA